MEFFQFQIRLISKINTDDDVIRTSDYKSINLLRCSIFGSHMMGYHVMGWLRHSLEMQIKMNDIGSIFGPFSTYFGSISDKILDQNFDLFFNYDFVQFSSLNFMIKNVSWFGLAWFWSFLIDSDQFGSNFASNENSDHLPWPIFNSIHSRIGIFPYH